MDPHEHHEHMARLDRMLEHQREVGEQLEQLTTRLDARPAATPQAASPLPLDPQHYETTIAQARRMAERETHPTWFQTAYADLAQRMARVEDRLDEMADSLRMILGQLAAIERQDRDT
jgi:hypothetical protein